MQRYGLWCGELGPHLPTSRMTEEFARDSHPLPASAIAGCKANHSWSIDGFAENRADVDDGPPGVARAAWPSHNRGHGHRKSIQRPGGGMGVARFTVCVPAKNGPLYTPAATCTNSAMRCATSSILVPVRSDSTRSPSSTQPRPSGALRCGTIWKLPSLS